MLEGFGIFWIFLVNVIIMEMFIEYDSEFCNLLNLESGV